MLLSAEKVIITRQYWKNEICQYFGILKQKEIDFVFCNSNNSLAIALDSMMGFFSGYKCCVPGTHVFMVLYYYQKPQNVDLFFQMHAVLDHKSIFIVYYSQNTR